MALEENHSKAVDQLAAAPNDANQPDTEGTNLHSTPVSDQLVRDRFPDVHAQAVGFLEKVKNRFGPNSHQSASVHNKLGEFLTGETSKRDTYFKILDELQNNTDLKGDFQAILHHGDAQWGPLDFQPETSEVNTHVSPDFLQPDHRPSLPMPTVSTFWDAGHYNRPMQFAQPSINPELLHGQLDMSYPTSREYRPHMYHAASETQGNNYMSRDPSGFIEHGDTTEYSRSTHTIPSALNTTNPYYEFSELNPHSLSTHGHEQALTFSASINSGYSHGLGMSSTVHQMTSYPQPSFSLKEAWNRAQYGNAAAHIQNVETDYSIPRTTSPVKSTSIPTPSLIGTPKVEPPPRSLLHALPLEEPFKHDSSAYFGVGGQHDNELETMNQGGFATDTKPISLPIPLVSTQANSASEPANQNPRSTRVKGEFIHSLCGKAFTTRHGVKKHHWGPKIDDRATTMGCWAKSGKPDIEWDEHPSCRDNSSTERASKRRSSQAKYTPFRMPTASSLIVSQGSMLTAIPTLENLPNIVAESLHSPPTMPHFPSYGEVIPYHAAQLPDRGDRGDHKNLETLLKVVNVASSIEAPTPESRNDSVVSQLDAKTASIGICGRHTPSWLETPWVSERGVGDKISYRNPYDRASKLSITGADHRLYKGSEDMKFSQCRLQKVGDVPTPTVTMGENRYIRTPDSDFGPANEHPGQNTLVEDDRKRLRSPYFRISKNEHGGLELGSSSERETKRQKSVGGQEAIPEDV